MLMQLFLSWFWQFHQLKMNKCPVPVSWGQMRLFLCFTCCSGLGKDSGSPLGSGLTRDFAHVSSLTPGAAGRDVQVKASHLLPNTAQSIVLTCSIPFNVLWVPASAFLCGLISVELSISRLFPSFILIFQQSVKTPPVLMTYALINLN